MNLEKGQAAMEYLMIMAIAMAMLVPLFSMVTSYTGETRTDLRVNSLDNSLKNLADAADMVYFQGHPARITTSFYAPEGVQYTNVTEHYFHVRLRTSEGIKDLSSRTQANLTGSIPDYPGNHKIELKMTKEGLVNVTY